MAMYKIYRLILLINLFGFIVTIHSFGQQKLIDSLRIVTQNNEIDEEERIRAFIDLTRHYQNNYSQSTITFAMADSALHMSKLKKNDELILRAYTLKAILLNEADSIQEAYNMIDTCLQYIDKVGDSHTKATTILNIADIKYSHEEDDKTLYDMFEALEMAKRIDNKDLMIKIYQYLVIAYYMPRNDMENIKKYANLAFDLVKYAKTKESIINAYSTKGAIYVKKQEIDKYNTAYFDSTQWYKKKALELSEAYSGYINPLIPLNITGSILASYANAQDENCNFIYPDSVQKYATIIFEKSLEYGDPYFTAKAYEFLSAYQDYKQNYTKMKELLLKGLETLDLMNENDILFLQAKVSMITSIAHHLYHTGEYKEALIYADERAEYLEKLYAKVYKKEGKIAEARFRVKEKEQELRLSQQKAKQHKQLFGASTIGAILLFLLLFTFYRSRLKTTKQRAILVEKENEEIRLNALVKEKELQKSESDKKNLELEKELEKEKAERRALEINRLQTELVAGISQLDQKNEMLEKIKGKIDDKDIKDLLLSDKIAGKSFEDFHGLFQKIHPLFYEKLQEKAEQKLTTLDLRYCTYILMNFTSKEIANIMHVDPNTVRTTKYRLKLKLNLSKEEDITTYLEELRKSLKI